jgi:hypothetical protein
MKDSSWSWSYVCPHTPVYVSSYFYLFVLNKDLLTSTFTLGSHERVIKTWCVPVAYPECVDCGKMYRYERFNVECQWTPTMENQLVRKGASMVSDKKTMIKKRLHRQNTTWCRLEVVQTLLLISLQQVMPMENGHVWFAMGRQFCRRDMDTGVSIRISDQWWKIFPRLRGEGFEQDEDTVWDVCGCFGLQVGGSVIHDLSWNTYWRNRDWQHWVYSIDLRSQGNRCLEQDTPPHPSLLPAAQPHHGGLIRESVSGFR